MHDITICICTLRRPISLRRLLQCLPSQQRDDRYSMSVVVVDNDALLSGQSVVYEASNNLQIPIRYFKEPNRNISLARNLAIANATGDLIAFIDDDEFPAEAWLDNLVECYDSYGVDGVLGPVKPDYEIPPPKWVLDGKLCERPTHPTGTRITGKDMRTGNALLSRALFSKDEVPFDPRFGIIGGGDVDFFLRQVEQGKSFIWCNEGIVFESVPAERLTRSYFLTRALSRGAANAMKTRFISFETFKSCLALGLYPLLFFFSILRGHGAFMKLLISYCDHLGKLMGLIGIRPVKGRPYANLEEPHK